MVAVTGVEVVVAKQLREIVRVLRVQLDDLQLREQQVGRRDRRRVECEAVAELDPVAHLERLDEHVELALGPVEDQAALAVQRVEARLRRVPALLEYLRYELHVRL